MIKVCVIIDINISNESDLYHNLLLIAASADVNARNESAMNAPVARNSTDSYEAASCRYQAMRDRSR